MHICIWGTWAEQDCLENWHVPGFVGVNRESCWHRGLLFVFQVDVERDHLNSTVWEMIDLIITTSIIDPLIVYLSAWKQAAIWNRLNIVGYCFHVAAAFLGFQTGCWHDN